MFYQLKCKIGALAAEAKFTRKFERREIKQARRIDKKYGGTSPDPDKYSSGKRRDRAVSMRLHRVHAIRKEARHAQLAYAFLRNRPYRLIEYYSRVRPDWDAIQEIALRFSEEDPRAIKQHFSEWKDAKLPSALVDKIRAGQQRALETLAAKRVAAKDARAKQAGDQRCI